MCQGTAQVSRISNLNLPPRVKRYEKAHREQGQQDTRMLLKLRDYRPWSTEIRSTY